MTNAANKMTSADRWLNAAGQVAKEAIWAPVAVYIVHHFLGERFGHEPYIDPVMHFAGGAAVAFLFWRSITIWQRQRGDFAAAKPVLLVFGLAVLVAMAWELMEYLIFVYNGTTKWWTLLNTLRDLALGATGAALLLAWLRRREQGARSAIS